ncbi:hypothetical protein SLEP1_g20253 [Rubroshorea leprosula]|uniref:Pentatricopeptide repeat-containing protein At3g28640 n=1 Tax=Rubroshorea leprosula TaxID=152421 RepID=A0AAV5J226_9ROSI|nr:hypothetical protein SLEP1_g20253 [Rubroshorea leprosula]
MSRNSTRVWNRCITLAQRCTGMHQLKPIHALFITHGLHRNHYAVSKLIAFCALSSTGDLHYASLLFNQVENPNSFIYNTLMRAYSGSAHPQNGFHYFNLMVTNGSVKPDCLSFNFVLIACANSCSLRSGRQIHNWVLKNGVAWSDTYVQTAIIRLYVECRIFGDARKVFDEIPCVDVVKWNVLMNGYIRSGLGFQALSAFREMLMLGFEPDAFCLPTVLTACAQSGALWQGKWIHEYVKKRKILEFDVFIGTALVDMYAKCGCIDMAVEVFEEMPKRNVFSWAAMIGGLAVHGSARKAIHCLERMQQVDRIRPDGVVLLGVLTACTHAGLVEKGQSLLDNMEARYGIMPKHEHYSCVVDLLCRAGRFEEALQLIRRMPMKPLASVWGALLNSCRTHNNIELAEVAVRELLQLEDVDAAEEEAALVQLSNMYLISGKSDAARRIRRMIGERGLKKTPGCSMIEVDRRVNEFVSGDVSHPSCAQIHAMLELLSLDLLWRLDHVGSGTPQSV